MKPAEVAGASDRTGEERLRALGSFIWMDAARVLGAARRYGDGTRKIIECELRGGSMSGAIPAGSPIRIALAHPPYRVGEIVAFLAGVQPVVHRVIYRRHFGGGKQLLTRGDAMLLPDPPIDASLVLGRVVEAAFAGGWRPVGPRAVAPRRERLLALLVLVASAVLLEISPWLARQFVRGLDAADRRFAWTKTLLY